MTTTLDPYAFVEDSEPRTRYPANADNLQNDTEQPPVDTVYANSAVNDDVTEPDAVPLSTFDTEPGKYFVRQVPRTPEIRDAILFSVFVPGDGVTRPFISRNPARYRLRVWTDDSNTGDVTIKAHFGDSGAAFSPGSIPFEFRSTNEFYCSATVAGTLYVSEEIYAHGGKG